MAYMKNRYGVLWDPVTGQLDEESVQAYEARTGKAYKTQRRGD